ncbi:DUF6470 family protein [Fictibacillus sp. KIGAM418]|uniref:DUF6470 family protein n=1 Tax=Fictibacillus marinisediminis TaxID=2878389 RepID=A0A9X1XDP5_9BACL|nr:DUF6470 family protein [Fictibacillus marinisediminis]MCK6258678.1 DUF6470 family protein [Fictibacillus marinisediminis]
MNIPQLKMESVRGQLSLSITQPVQEIEQPAAELSIEQWPAELDIERTPGKLTIDQSQARADMDLKSISRRIEEFAQKGYSDWLEGMARLSQQGDELMRIENGGNAIASQAKENGESPMLEFNIAFIPSANSVKTNYEPGKVDLNWKVSHPKIEVKVNKPIHIYTPGIVHGGMKQWPSLTISVTGLELDEKK